MGQNKKTEYVMQTDGGSVNNPGPASIGWYVTENDKTILAYGLGHIGVASNNVAEYSALLRGLEYAVEHELFPLTVRMDSQLVLNQVMGNWKCNEAALQKILAQILELTQPHVDQITYTWVRRLQNQSADQLVNQAHTSRQPYQVIAINGDKTYNPLVAQLQAKHRAGLV